jgi:hypothetical protein
MPERHLISTSVLLPPGRRKRRLDADADAGRPDLFSKRQDSEWDTLCSKTWAAGAYPKQAGPQ